MSDVASLQAEIDAFARIVDELAAIARRTDPERRTELTRLRRQLSEQIGRLRDTGGQVFAGSGMADEFRSRLSSALHVVAMHQANWPAISIDTGGERYRQSAAAARDSNRAFIEWTRATLAQLG